MASWSAEMTKISSKSLTFRHDFVDWMNSLYFQAGTECIFLAQNYNPENCTCRVEKLFSLFQMKNWESAMRQDDPRHEHENWHSPGNRGKDFNLNSAFKKMLVIRWERILEALKSTNDIRVKV